MRKYTKKRSTKRYTRKHRVSKTKYANKKYTALIPKTVKATRYVVNKAVKTGYSFLNTAKQSVKSLSSGIDKQTAKAIRSLTKRRK